MNFTEQKNYLIAVIVSLTFHFLLLIISLPGILASKKPVLETFPVGLVEIASGSPKGVMVPLPKNHSDLSVAFNSTGSRQLYKGKTEMKSNVNPNQPPKDATELSKKEEIAVSGNSMDKPGNQSAPSGKIEMKSYVNPNQLPRNVTVLPKNEAIAVSGNHLEKPGDQRSLSGTIEEITNFGNSGTTQTRFGTGKAMVTDLQPMPPYPPDL